MGSVFLIFGLPAKDLRVTSITMKSPHFIASICALVLLVGCAAINRTEQNLLLQHNVSPVVSERMIRGEILTLSEIIELSQKQVPPEFIIHYLYSTRAIYALDKPALARLNAAKVCKEITDYLLETPDLFAPRPYPRAYYGGPWYPYDPYYYPYYPYGPRVYGGATVVIGRGCWHH